jgi:acetyl esterase/lipase
MRTGSPKNRPLIGLVGAGILLLVGCEPIGALSAFQNGPSVSDVPFTRDGTLALDVYVPDRTNDQAGSLPVIVFFYGGRWEQGSKKSYRFVGSQLASRGFVTVLPDYRLYPDVRFPEFVEDAAAAVAWTFDHVRDHGGDPGRVFVMGHSAGAHIASLVHYDERYLERTGAERATCGFVGLSGPYDFLPLVAPDIQDIFPTAVRDDSQPVAFVDGAEGPALLVHGMRDDTVEPRNAASLAEAVARAGGQAEVELYDDRGHVGVLLSLAPPFRFLAPTLDRVTEFVLRQPCAPHPDPQRPMLTSPTSVTLASAPPSISH